MGNRFQDQKSLNPIQQLCEHFALALIELMEDGLQFSTTFVSIFTMISNLSRSDLDPRQPLFQASAIQVLMMIVLIVSNCLQILKECVQIYQQVKMDLMQMDVNTIPAHLLLYIYTFEYYILFESI